MSRAAVTVPHEPVDLIIMATQLASYHYFYGNFTEHGSDVLSDFLEAEHNLKWTSWDSKTDRVCLITIQY